MPRAVGEELLAEDFAIANRHLTAVREGFFLLSFFFLALGKWNVRSRIQARPR